MRTAQSELTVKPSTVTAFTYNKSDKKALADEDDRLDITNIYGDELLCEILRELIRQRKAREGGRP